MKSQSLWTRGFSAGRDYTTRSRCRPVRTLEGVHRLRTEPQSQRPTGAAAGFTLYTSMVLKGPQMLYLIKENLVYSNTSTQYSSTELMHTRTGMDINWSAIRSDIRAEVNVPCIPSRRPGWAEQPDPRLAAKTEAQEAWDLRSNGQTWQTKKTNRLNSVKSLGFAW